MPTEPKPRNKDPYVATKATCGGCKYYRTMMGNYMLACHYTLDTGKPKPLDMRCDECTLKEKGKRKGERWK